MDLEKKVFTTFEVAKICNANITSIKNWIDKGELSAFRTPGGHYRIERKVLRDFLNRHSMPNPFLEREKRRILVVHRDPSLVDELRERFGDKHDYQATDDPIDAVLRLGEWRPTAAVLDADLEGLPVDELCCRVREHGGLRPVDLIVVHSQDDCYAEQLSEAGASFVVGKAEGKDALYEAVRRSIL